MTLTPNLRAFSKSVISRRGRISPNMREKLDLRDCIYPDL